MKWSNERSTWSIQSTCRTEYNLKKLFYYINSYLSPSISQELPIFSLTHVLSLSLFLSVVQSFLLLLSLDHHLYSTTHLHPPSIWIALLHEQIICGANEVTDCLSPLPRGLTTQNTICLPGGIILQYIHTYHCLLIYITISSRLSPSNFNFNLLTPSQLKKRFPGLLYQPISIYRTSSSSTIMATEWSLDFCLACDRQTSGGPYCSQSCRLAELDLVSSDPLKPSTTTRDITTNPHRWNNSTIGSRAYPRNSSRVLSPSSSQTSLSSLQSNSSSKSAMSDRFQDELRDYASCFDQVRDLKRRMTS